MCVPAKEKELGKEKDKKETGKARGRGDKDAAKEDGGSSSKKAKTGKEAPATRAAAAKQAKVRKEAAEAFTGKVMLCTCLHGSQSHCWNGISCESLHACLQAADSKTSRKRAAKAPAAAETEEEEQGAKRARVAAAAERPEEAPATEAPEQEAAQAAAVAEEDVADAAAGERASLLISAVNMSFPQACILLHAAAQAQTGRRRPPWQSLPQPRHLWQSPSQSRSRPQQQLSLRLLRQFRQSQPQKQLPCQSL
jgi:hypothetical protein